MEASRGSARLQTQKNLRLRDSDYETYELHLNEWLRYLAAGVGFAALTAYVFYRSFAVFLFLLPFGLYFPLYKRGDLKEVRKQKLNMEFKEAILILSSFLSAGYSVENAFAASEKELYTMYGENGLITVEFSHMAGQIATNRPVEAVLAEFADKSGLDDVRNFAEVFAAAKRSGGELVSIISHTAAVIRDKACVKEEILTEMASKQFEQKIMNLIPFFIVLYIELTSPGFFSMMYETAAGRGIMTACLVVYLAAYALAERIMKIEV